MGKIKVGIVNYLNTKPLLYGIEHAPVKKDIELVEDYPSGVARLLTTGKIDIGLVPVSVIPLLPEYYIETGYCIGCDGPVASVCLFSEVPVEEVEEVLLDYQSRTSVALVKILMQEYWKASPRYNDTKNDFRSAIKGKTAGVIIGDRALEQRNVSPFIYDLGEAWKNHTGLPFVFAAWVSNKKLPEDFIDAFNEANKYGIENIEQVVAENSFPVFDLHEYYTRYIQYHLDSSAKKGMKKFLSLLTSLATW